MSSEAKDADAATPQIGTLNENPLHAGIKQWLARPGDRLEVALDGYLIDLVQSGLLIEVQTRNFGAIAGKLSDLLDRHPVRLVYPIAETKWIVKVDEEGKTISRRKSPKRGRVESVFAELVRIPHICGRQNFSLQVVLTEEEEVRRFVGRGWRKRGWRTELRRLLAVNHSERFDSPEELAALLPQSMTEPFGTADIAATIGVTRRLAQQMAYTLRRMGMIAMVGKQGNAQLYARI